MPGAPENSVVVRRMRNTLLLPRDIPPHSAAARAAVGALGEKALAEALGRTLGAIDQRDGSLAFIRRLEIECDLDLSHPAPTLLKHWARVFTRRLQRALRDANRGPDCVRFSSRAEYVAHFIRDLAAGRAWRTWYYGPFEGLRSLPTAMALRTALLDDPPVGLAALALLPAPSRHEVIARLSERGAWRVLHGFGNSGTGAPDLSPGWPQLDESGTTFAADLSVARRAVALLVEAHGARAPLPLPTLSAWAAARSLFDDLERTRPETCADVYSRIVAADEPGLLRLLPAEDVARLAPVLRQSRPVRERLVRRRRPARPQAELSPTRRSTPFGGAFLFLPVLADLAVEDAVDGWPEAPDVPAAALIRLVLVSLCFGPRRALGCFNDPLIRDLTGVGPGLGLAQTRAYLRSVPLDAIDAFVRALTGGERRDTVQLRAFRLNRRIGLAVDADRGHWLAARAMPEDSDRAFEAWCRATFDSAELMHCADERPYDPVDFRFLTAPALAGGIRRRFALAVAAQGLWRGVARRLGALGDSSLPWLANNLLPPGATWVKHESRRQVYLARPPLGVLLNMTGLDRQRYALPWLGDVSIELYGER